MTGSESRSPVAAGTSKKVALIACMRKLLTILHVMMRTHTRWREMHNQEMVDFKANCSRRSSRFRLEQALCAPAAARRLEAPP